MRRIASSHRSLDHARVGVITSASASSFHRSGWNRGVSVDRVDDELDAEGFDRDGSARDGGAQGPAAALLAAMYGVVRAGIVTA
jgi:hypothetical protein